MTSWLPEPFVVCARTEDAPDTVTLALAPPRDREAGAGSPSAPGQFNMLYAHGVGEIPVSISGVARDGALLHTIRDVGPVSKALCGLRRGAEVGVRGPFGTSWPLAKLAGSDVLVIAGGLGLAPLRPVIRAIAKDRAAFGRVEVYYGGRSPETLLYEDERVRWATEDDIKVATSVDHADASWTGHVGVVTTLLPRALARPEKTAALVCGPEVMMRFAAADLKSRGVPPERIYLSLERNMKCALGVCGHCFLSRHFVCKDGPVFALPRVEALLAVAEL